VTLTDVDVEDPLLGGTLASGETIAVGGEETYTGSYTITQADVDSQGDLEPDDLGGDDDDGNIDNTATADSAETEEVSDSAQQPIAYQPGIDLVKLVDVGDGNGFQDANDPAGPEAPVSDGDATFRIELTNTGNVTLTGITISDFDSATGEIDLSGFTLIESGNQDGILDVGESAYLEYTLPLVAGQHLNIASVTTDQGAADEDPAYYFGLESEGPGVRTPGGWGNSFKLLSYWDGVEGNEIEPEKDEFPDGELTYNVRYDSNGDGDIDENDEIYNPDNDLGTVDALLIGDYNKNGYADDGETVILIDLDDALDLVRNEADTPKQNKIDDVGRQAVATWLNYLAGNSITDGDADIDSDDAEYWIDQAVGWLLEHGDGAPKPNGDSKFDLNGPIVRARSEAWKSEGKDILDALDEYNNEGTVNGAVNALDADEANSTSASLLSGDQFDYL
ncbi:hypothetical protein, partial [Ruegeria lacuscaerulensis]